MKVSLVLLVEFESLCYLQIKRTEEEYLKLLGPKPNTFETCISMADTVGVPLDYPTYSHFLTILKVLEVVMEPSELPFEIIHEFQRSPAL